MIRDTLEDTIKECDKNIAGLVNFIDYLKEIKPITNSPTYTDAYIKVYQEELDDYIRLKDWLCELQHLRIVIKAIKEDREEF